MDNPFRPVKVEREEKENNMACAQWSESYDSIRKNIAEALNLPKDFQQDVETLEEFMRSGKSFLVLDEVYEPFEPGRVGIVTDEGTDKTISLESFNRIFRPVSCQSRVQVCPLSAPFQATEVARTGVPYEKAHGADAKF